jgi:hypothetical protein
VGLGVSIINQIGSALEQLAGLIEAQSPMVDYS